MTDAINWIHFTDLHLGLDSTNSLWPRVKHDLMRDIEKLTSQVNGWDVVFFTGDLVQTGHREEFDRLNNELDDIWKVLAKSGNDPVICAVPGNHDLTRPAETAATTKALTQLWSDDPSLRRLFWNDPNSEYRIAISEIFFNYTSWLANLSVPCIEMSYGLLPGDFTATVNKGNVRLGVIGLNTTFLQIVNGNMEKRLDAHVSQLVGACGGDPEEWIKQRTSSVLLTHQPPSWLTLEGYEHFRQEIYPPGRFLAQFCGHLHDPQMYELAEAGGAPRRLRQAPSLFGLENWSGATPQQRLHGYNAGQFVFSDGQSYERFWPRVAIKARHGGLNISPDHTFALNEAGFIITPFATHSEAIVQSLEDVGEESQTTAPPEVAVQLLETPPDERKARLDLAFCPRFSGTVLSQHKAVRQEEQSQSESELRRARVLWLIADWGTGCDGFLPTLFERFRTQDSKPDAFHLKCEEALDTDAFESLFPQQFGMAMQPFCYLVNAIPNAFLILDGIHPDLCADEGLRNLKRIVSAILDYCSELRVVIVSRMLPPENGFPVVTLLPLDAPDARMYVMHHPDYTPESEDPDTIEKIHEQADGMPMHIDRILKALKVTSLPRVLEAELEGRTFSVAETPLSLVHTVDKLGKSADTRSKRSSRLLRVLSVLPYGETLDLPMEPFFLENALQLKELNLLDVVSLQRANLHVRSRIGDSTDAGSPKLLKVPRQVRDYVNTLLSEEERLDIVLAGLERFFGREWRAGKVKLRTLPLEYREYLASGAGNEFALIHHLIAFGTSNEDDNFVRRGAALGIRYANHLKASDRYRDLTIVSGALNQLISQEQYPAEWARLAACYGTGLRMTGKHKESLVYLRGALEIGDSFLGEEEMASIWLNIALSEEMLGNKDSAIAAANKVEETSKDGSGIYLHAEAILAGLTLKGDSRSKQLAELEIRARAHGHTVLADNIALEFAQASDSPAKTMKHLDKVLQSNSSGYNQARAIVAKTAAFHSKEGAGQMDAQMMVRLCQAYSYLHAQRFSVLFDRCHEQLWRAGGTGRFHPASTFVPTLVVHLAHKG
jgi:predicted MPP superfamily phosphohydrolase/tetratricopeptide (TPR) repeat protein